MIGENGASGFGDAVGPNCPAFQELHEWTVGEMEAGLRIDKWIADLLEPDVSRTRVQQWLKNGDVAVNGVAAKPNYKLVEGDEVVCRVPLPENLQVPAESMYLDIVYEDEHLLVVNKPRGMVVHPAPGHYTGTLVNGLLAHCQDLSGINGVLRPGIVHRIDKDTSGLLMVAKHDRAHIGLTEQLQRHTVQRQYVALVQGVVPHEKGTVDAPIGRDPHDRQAMTVTERNGKAAVTHFSLMERFRAHTLLRLQLETGRTHQIRVHMKYIGYPLVGDPKYGSGKSRTLLAGQALHAERLGFIHPVSGNPMLFEVPLPKEFDELLVWLRLRDS